MRSIVATLAEEANQVDLDLLSAGESREFLELAAQVERMAAGLRLLVARRAARALSDSDADADTDSEATDSEATDSETERGAGAAAAAMLASVSGTTMSEARSMLRTSERMGLLPAIRAAAGRGEFSASQLKAITDAATADPSCELDLLDAARGMPVEGLQRLARRIQADTAAASAAATPAAAVSGPADSFRARRDFHLWSDPDGLMRFSGAVVPEDGARLAAKVRSRAAFVADEAMAAGLDPEPQSAYDADALVALVLGDHRRATFSGTVGGGSHGAVIELRASLEALRRGEVGDGEICEIVGVGPVSPATVESVAGDGVCRLVIEDGGGDGEPTCTELGRIVPEEISQALEARDRMCVVPGCSVGVGLHTDFWQVPFGRGGPPELWNLARLCRFHHRLKTFEGYRLTGGPGYWEWRAPP